MGYDMSRVGEATEEERLRLKEAEEHWNAALKKRDSLPEELAERPEMVPDITSDQKMKLVDKLVDEGEDFFLAHTIVFKAPTEEWIEAQREVLKASAERYAADSTYFRLNIWGMGECRNAMEYFGMIYWCDHPTFPQLTATSDFNDDEVVQAFWDWEDDPSQTPARSAEVFEMHRKRQDHVLSYRDEEIRGIPGHKFGSNDGWHVTAAECSEAVSIYMEADKTDMPEDVQEVVTAEWWSGWLNWLTNCSQHEGFKVY